MEEPENIVANWTYGYGNIPYASSEDNVPAVERLDHTEGLASYRAATSWRMPGWNCLKYRNGPCVNMVAGSRECRAPGLWVKAVSGGKFGYVHLWSSPVYRQRHVSRDWNANREVPPAISDAPISITCEVGHVRAGGTAHVVVVAMMPMITSRTSEGPLDGAGHVQWKVEGTWQLPVNFGCTDGPQHMGISRSQNVGSACSFKRIAKCASNRKGRVHMKWQRLKPDTGNRSVRDFRGLDGDGGIGVFPPEVLGASGLSGDISVRCPLRHHSTRRYSERRIMCRRLTSSHANSSGTRLLQRPL